MYLRPIRLEDRDSLAELLRHTDNFNPEEVEVALELIDEALHRPVESGYCCLIAAPNAGAKPEEVLGYACYGKTPMTESTYDLYWIVVDAAHREQGIGRQILQALIQTLRADGGTILRVETSSQESYRGTLKFYEREGFTIAGRIPSFYKPGDDLIILIHLLGH